MHEQPLVFMNTTVHPTHSCLGQGLCPCQGHSQVPCHCQGQGQSHGPCPPCQGQGLRPCHHHANCLLCCLRRLANHSMCQSQGLRHCHHCLRICPASHSCRRGQTNCVTPRFPVAHHPMRCHVGATPTWLDHGIHNACLLAPVKMACAQSCTSLCCLCSIPLLIYCCCPAPCVCFCMWLYMVCTSCNASSITLMPALTC